MMIRSKFDQKPNQTHFQDYLLILLQPNGEDKVYKWLIKVVGEQFYLYSVEVLISNIIIMT